MIAKFVGKYRGAPQGTWMPGGGIKILGIYFLFETKFYISSV